MDTSHCSQPGILGAVPSVGRYLVFELRLGTDPRPALLRLSELLSPERIVVGLGLPLVLQVGAQVPGLRAFPALSGPGCSFPSTQGALWAFVAGSDPTEVHDRSRSVCAILGEEFVLREEVAAFQYRQGRDLTGYEDGTENPRDDKATAAAIVSGQGAGLDGSSFVAVQRYVHDHAGFARLTPEARDHAMGRRASDNEEIADAPASAHVKRTAQESFEPTAFMVRRSMPWGGVAEHGLYFVAYGESLDRFERMLTRMAGIEDGIVDALMGFSRALSGGYYWCPPIRDGRYDWSAIGV
jgi:putative iron-dependent peroxidase